MAGIAIIPPGSFPNENPFQTPSGLTPMSIQESFESRLWREGLPVQAFNVDVALTAGVQADILGYTVSLGKEFIPLFISVSCDQDAVLQIQYITSITGTGYNSQGVWYETEYCKAGTPFRRTLKGEIRIPETYGIHLIVKSATAGKAYGTIYGIEVTANV